MKKSIILVISACVFFISIILVLGSLAFNGSFRFNPEKFGGYQGRLTIESADINLACVQPIKDGNTIRQFLVNQQDCASMIPMNSMNGCFATIIADHNYQEFSTLELCKIGDAAMFTSKDGTKQFYEVTANFRGLNKDGQLRYQSGENVIPDNDGGIILYTCLEDAVNVRIVFLHPISS